MAGSRLKASEKKTVCKKVVNLLKKRFGGTIPKSSKDVLNTLLFAICLEDNPHADADEAFDHLMDSFHDLNEIRVSSVMELETVFDGVRESEWKALRVRSLLQYIFEENFQFEYEGIRRKTYEQAFKQVSRIKDISPFVVLQALQSVLGSHVVPADSTMIDCLVWTGLIGPCKTGHDASDQLKSFVAKPEVATFCHLVRSLAMDTKCRDQIRQDLDAIGNREFDPTTCVERLTDLFNSIDRRRVRKHAVIPEVIEKKPTTKKVSAKKTAPKKPASKKTAAKKPAAKKPAVKKPAAKKPAAKKPAAKKPAAKKKTTAVKKKSASVKKKPAKKSAVKKKTKSGSTAAARKKRVAVKSKPAKKKTRSRSS